ncbi:hypothetical protein [Bifidobacterium samirii]|uniref:Uncharacterized protein n=1 Tax=Bifidobacterium samirii TaxID=2306974 RepID=A0A430FPD8_9BIFI|nr:hypothetical protein [Bifidobacterium samirii]RSX54691.1 hypothetical protein D2E24_1461 [Bifidobacterium samirii]
MTGSSLMTYLPGRAWRPVPHVAAIDVTGLTPVEPADLAGPLTVAVAGCLVAAVLFAVLVWFLSRPRRARRTRDRRGAHVDGAAAGRWHRMVADIVDGFESGAIDRQEAFVRLAQVARAFASARTGDDMSARTLVDLNRMPRSTGMRGGFDLLRQTIAALYPPEFADPALDRQAGAADVRQAAGWVDDLIERWRR